MEKIWTDRAWDDYLYWQSQDKKTINLILVNVGVQAPSASLRSRNPPPLRVLPMKDALA